MEKRTIFIGDVHGCYDELQELMDKIDPHERDRVIFLWDLINKWPKSAEVVSYVHKNRYECVMGNHELSYSRKFEAPGRYADLRSKISDEVHEWLLALPKYIEAPGFIAVHGGIIPGTHPSESPIEILSEIRTWNHEENTLGGDSHTPWYQSYAGQKPVFYGHWAIAGLTIRENTFGLDSGCVYGGKLSAHILETGELFQVAAKQMYEIPKKPPISS